MVCIQCGAKTKVTNSREQQRTQHVWRRRQCQGCQTIFTTLESPDYYANWLVQPARGRLAPFKRDKLFLSLYDSLEHRKNALDEAGTLAETVTAKLKSGVKAGVLPGKLITQTVQVALNRFDKAAAVRYAALHKD